MKAIIRWTVRQRKAFIIWWIIGMCGYVAMEVGLYPTIAKQGASFSKAIAQMPDTVKAFIGASADFLTPAGFLGSEIYYLIVPILFAILSIGLGSSLLAREEQSGTLELLLSRPLSRVRVLAGKAVAGLLITSLIAAFVALMAVFMAWVSNMDIAKVNIIETTAMCYLLALVFGAFAFMLTAAGGVVRGTAVALSTGLLLAGYVLTSLEKQVHWLVWAARLFPYHYYQPTQILLGHFTWRPTLAYLAVIAICGVLAVSVFRHRDIS